MLILHLLPDTRAVTRQALDRVIVIPKPLLLLLVIAVREVVTAVAIRSNLRFVGNHTLDVVLTIFAVTVRLILTASNCTPILL